MHCDMYPESWNGLGDFLHCNYTVELICSIILTIIKVVNTIFRGILNIIGENVGNTNSPRGSSSRSSAILNGSEIHFRFYFFVGNSRDSWN